MLVVDIAGHTAERYEQTVEIASALIGVRGIELQKLDVHRQGTDKTGGNHLIWKRLLILEIDIDADPFRSRIGTVVVIDFVLVDGPCTPVEEVGGCEQLEHALRAPSAGI